MHRTASNRSRMRTAALFLFALGLVRPVDAASTYWLQQVGATQGTRIVSSEIAISREQAELKLELASGRKLTLSTVASGSRGVIQSGVSGSPDDLSQILSLGVERGDALDRAWRQLLNQAMDTPTDDLARLLGEWDAPVGGEPLDDLIESALAGTPAPNVGDMSPPELGDSLGRLQERISELQQALENVESHRFEAIEQHADDRGGIDWFAPLRHLGRGVAGILSLLVTFAVLFGLGFAMVFFGGRKYLEGVADATRQSTARSFLVGLAASFLVIPVFVLGIVVLAISIVGIPALLIWVPAFPLAIVLATMLGYLAVAHAAGEAFAERRFYGGDWFSRANSYYYLLTGLGLLLVLFLASHVVQMAGPWLGFIHNILMFLGVVLTWAAATTGFGAVLITRAGTRGSRGANLAESETFADASAA
ncbi:MAG: hypothetical protein ACRENP_25135 [Longimicrobiales bacterium]